MTVAQLRAEMGNREFGQWGVYYARLNQQMELQKAAT